MKFAKTHSIHATLTEECAIDITVDISQGLFSFHIVGLASKAVEEARERIYSAIRYIGYDSPKTKNHKIVSFLGPAHLHKNSTHFDLGITIAYLIASQNCTPKHSIHNTCFIGELSPNGEIRGSGHIVPLFIAARNAGFDKIIIPHDSKYDIYKILGTEKIFACKHLREVIDLVEKDDTSTLIKPLAEGNTDTDDDRRNKEYEIDTEAFRGIVEQDHAKRAVVIALTGLHHILFWGEPGSGKNLITEAAKELLPDLDAVTALELARIRAFSNTNDTRKWTKAHSLSPNHNITKAQLLGSIVGQKNPIPGALSLCHGGILGLHEYIEIKNEVLESMREPMENRYIMLGNIQNKIPSNALIIATCNPCPCGNLGNHAKKCICSPALLKKYTQKISGALLDRFHIYSHITNNTVHKSQLNQKKSSNIVEPVTQYGSIADLKKKITQARAYGRERNYVHFGYRCLNHEIQHYDIQQYIHNHYRHAEDVILAFAREHALSLRTVHNLMKIARTIADLDFQETISIGHALEAVQFREQTVFGR